MSVSLGYSSTHDLIAVRADDVPTDVATDPFSAGPGVFLVLVVLAVLLAAAIGRVLALVWSVLRRALPVLGVLVLGLGIVLLLGVATLTSNGGSPADPATTAHPTAHPTAPRASGHPAPRRHPGAGAPSRPPSSLGDLAPSHR